MGKFWEPEPGELLAPGHILLCFGFFVSMVLFWFACRGVEDWYNNGGKEILSPPKKEIKKDS